MDMSHIAIDGREIIILVRLVENMPKANGKKTGLSVRMVRKFKINLCINNKNEIKKNPDIPELQSFYHLLFGKREV